MTIPILFRTLMTANVSSTGDEQNDFRACSYAIQVAICTGDQFSSQKLVLAHVLLGIKNSPARFYSKLASKLAQLPSNSDNLEQAVQLFRNVHGCAPDNEEFVLAAACSGAFWTELFRFLVRLAERHRASAKENVQQVGQLESIDDDTEQKFVRTAVTILHAMGSLCVQLNDDFPDGCEALVNAWTRANMFGMMDEVIPLIVFQPNVPRKSQYL